MIPRAQIQTYRHTVDTLHLVLDALKNRQKVPSYMSLSQYLELLAIQEARKAGVEPIKAERTEETKKPDVDSDRDWFKKQIRGEE